MRLHRVVKIDETNEFFFAVFATSKLNFIMPHLEQSSDHALGFAVRLRAFHAGESLRNFVFGASFDEVVRRISAVFRAVVRVNYFDRIRTFRDDLSEKFRRTELRFIGQNSGKKLAGIVVDRDKKMFAGISFELIFQKRESFRVEMNELAGVLFFVSPRPFFQFLLQLFFNSRESFAAEFETAESFIHARSRLKFLQSRAFQNFVNGRSTDAISLRKLSGIEVLFGVFSPDFSPLNGSESGVGMDGHIYRLMELNL